MELIDRYVSAVGARLGANRRAAVEAELRAALLDALEDRGANPDDEDAVVEVLRELGDPARVAAGYEPAGQYLIGPELFPTFRRAARWLIGSLALGGAVAVVVRLLLAGLVEADAGAVLADTIRSLVRAALFALVALVGVFYALQRSEVRLPRIGGDWDPRSLAELPRRDRVAQLDAIVVVGASVIGMVVVDGLLDAADIAMAHAPAGLRPLVEAAARANLVLLQAALAVAALVHTLALVQRRWHAYTRAARFGAEVLALVVFVRLPFQVIPYRAALIEDGFSAPFVNSLVLNLLAIAAAWASTFVIQQRRAFMRRSADPGAARDGRRPTPPTARTATA